MKRCLAWIGVLLVATLALGFSASAAGIPTTLSYRGTMTDKAGQPLNTSKSLEFNLYDVATDGVAFWTEVQTVTITNGQFTVLLGADQANLIDLSKFGGDTWLGIRVSGEPEMTPRQKMTSVPYALNGVPKGVITMWSGSIATIPQGWQLCDGSNGTPDLRDRFVVGAGNYYSVGAANSSNYIVNLQHQHDLSNHTHKGYGDGGDLRAAIGAAQGAPETIGYISVGAVNPNTGTSPGSTTYVSVGAGWWGSTWFSHFTPVYGYTSAPINNSSGIAGNSSMDIRPPYYSLAYIMKL